MPFELMHSKYLELVEEEFKKMGMSFGTHSIMRYAVKFTSFLYSAGADHAVWRRWASLASFGHFLDGDVFRSAMFAVLAGEWKFVESLYKHKLTLGNFSEIILWHLITGQQIYPGYFCQL